MKMRIYLKNGTVLPDIECDEFNVKTYDGVIEEYEIVGAEVPRPLFVCLDEISAICRVD